MHNTICESCMTRNYRPVLHDRSIGGLRNKYKGAHIAVVGASPTAVLYVPHSTDVSIAVNGAALLSEEFDYFVCSDPDAPARPWFGRKCAKIRVIAMSIATMDRQLYPSEFDGHIDRRAVPWGSQHRITAPPPVQPHYVFHCSFPSKGELEAFSGGWSTNLMVRGTVAGQAIQLAFIMGAAEISLFGCSYSRDTSRSENHYSYQCQQHQIGCIQTYHIEAMNTYISIIRQHGVPVNVIGPSALTCPPS